MIPLSPNSVKINLVVIKSINAYCACSNNTDIQNRHIPAYKFCLFLYLYIIPNKSIKKS
jgi:hypothetical protein